MSRFDVGPYPAPRPAARGEVGESAAALVAPGLAMIAVTYGLGRFAYGLFVPQLRESFELSSATLGSIAAGSYAGYCVAILASLSLTARVGPRRMVTAAGLLSATGMAIIAAAPTAGMLAAGVLIAGSSTGLASPPMAEAVSIRVRTYRRDRANAWINSGTSIGVALSAPAAALAAAQWRMAWAAFAVIALGVVGWNISTMPPARRGISRQPRPRPHQGAAQLRSDRRVSLTSLAWVVGKRTSRLYVAAAVVGFTSAVYWTFARDLVVRAGDMGHVGSTVFWAVIGVAGLAGGAAGDLIGQVGLGHAYGGALLSMALAIALLAVAPGALPVSYLSAALFGATYIMLTGVILVLSLEVFPQRPAAGLGAGFLMIAFGQVVGSPVAGALAAGTTLRVAFLAFAALATAAAWIRLAARHRSRHRMDAAAPAGSHRVLGGVRERGRARRRPGPEVQGPRVGARVRHGFPGPIGRQRRDARHRGAHDRRRS